MESRALQVSKSVKRGMNLARKALENQGYEVVEFGLTEEEIEYGAKYLLGIVSSGLKLG